MLLGGACFGFKEHMFASRDFRLASLCFLTWPFFCHVPSCTPGVASGVAILPYLPYQLLLMMTPQLSVSSSTATG
jgi:hypothetical protein